MVDKDRLERITAGGDEAARARLQTEQLRRGEIGGEDAPPYPGFIAFVHTHMRAAGLDRDTLPKSLKGHRGKSIKNVGRWLAGTALPNAAWQKRLADALGLDLAIVEAAVVAAEHGAQQSLKLAQEEAMRPPPAPVPVDDPEGAAPLEPLWTRFARGEARFRDEVLRFQRLWGGPLAVDLQRLLELRASEVHRPWIRGTFEETDDAFEALLKRGSDEDWHLFFGGWLAIKGPELHQSAVFYAVIEPSRPTTRVLSWDFEYAQSKTLALDIPSFDAMCVCGGEVVPDDITELRQQLRDLQGRIAFAWPWDRWFDALQAQHDLPFAELRSDLPDADRHMLRAAPIIETLRYGKPFAMTPITTAEFEHELMSDEVGFATFPPRALYWMWRAALEGNDEVLSRVLNAVTNSPSKMVQDACAHARAWGSA